MSDPASLLPSNATPLMRAVSLTNAARRPMALGPIGAMLDPAAIPAAVLPYLAAANGVSVWKPEWSDDRKRAVIARSIVLKRRRGTVPCFEGHLAFVDAQLVRFLATPQRPTPRKALTVDEEAAWLAQFPELRIYYFRNRSHRPAVLTPGVWRTARLTPLASRADGDAGARAEIVRGGVANPVRIAITGGESEFAREVEVALAVTGRRFVLGQALARPFAFARASDAAERLYSFRPVSNAPRTVRPQITPFDATPKRVAGRSADLHLVTVSRAWNGPHRFLRASTARQNVYDAFRLFDPALARAGRSHRQGGWTLGLSRLGQPAFQVELALDLTFQRRKVRRFPNLPGFVEKHDSSRTDEALAAIRGAKLGRDQVLMRSNLHRRITAGDGVPLDGSFRLGQIIRSL